MANSAVDIANSALILVGADRISSLSDAVKPARLINEMFDDQRDKLLTHHPWNFAIKRQALARSSTNPVFDYSYAYVLPSDCLRVIDTNLGDDSWKREGDTIVANFSDVKIRYIAKITDISKWSWSFREALAYKLAVQLAYSLVQSTSLANSLKQDYLAIVRDAKSQDAQESGVMVIEADDWLNSRY